MTFCSTQAPTLAQTLSSGVDSLAVFQAVLVPAVTSAAVVVLVAWAPLRIGKHGAAVSKSVWPLLGRWHRHLDLRVLVLVLRQHCWAAQDSTRAAPLEHPYRTSMHQQLRLAQLHPCKGVQVT